MKRKYDIFNAESNKRVGELDATVIESDEFALKEGDPYYPRYLREKAQWLIRDKNLYGYANYNEYVYTINTLNACLSNNIENAKKWLNELNKLQKNCLFRIPILLPHWVPYNPFHAWQTQRRGEKKIERSLFDFIQEHPRIDSQIKEEIHMLFIEDIFTVERGQP